MVNPESSGDPKENLLVGFAGGDTIFREGQPGREMFIIQEGQVEILKRFGPRERRLALLETGDFFGEMAVLEDQPRSAGARAVTDCRLLPIDASTFDQMLREHPEIAIRIMRKLSRRLREHDEASYRAQEIAAGPLSGVSREGMSQLEPVMPPEVEAAAAAAAAHGTAPAAAGAARLVHLESGATFSLTADRERVMGRHDPVTGQSPEIDLGVIDTRRSLSRRHARIGHRDGSYYVREEIGTSNGTFLDGVRLSTGQEHPLHDGQILRLGLVELVFHAGGGG